MQKIPKLKPYTIVCTHTHTSREFSVNSGDLILSLSLDPTPGDLRLVVRPADTVVSSGSSVELYCVAEGPRPTSLLWLRDGLLVNDEEHVLIVGGGQVLEIRGATDAHEGTYMCVVSDGSQSVNASAVVTVVGECYASSLASALVQKRLIQHLFSQYCAYIMCVSVRWG